MSGKYDNDIEYNNDDEIARMVGNDSPCQHWYQTRTEMMTEAGYSFTTPRTNRPLPTQSQRACDGEFCERHRSVGRCECVPLHRSGICVSVSLYRPVGLLPSRLKPW